MYSIFHALDPDERLPRELILEHHRWRRPGLRFIELAAVAYLPGLVLAIVVMGSLGINLLVAFGAAGLLLAGVYVYAIKARYR